MYSEHNLINNNGESSIKVGITSNHDTDICAGAGLGAILLTCKEKTGEKTDIIGEQKYNLNAAIADSTSQLSNSYSITWSYTTSSNPGL